MAEGSAPSAVIAPHSYGGKRRHVARFSAATLSKNPKMCTRQQALRRLTGKWLAEVARDPDTARRMPLSQILTEDNLNCVQVLELYAEFEEWACGNASVT
jgi:hypothetical protein